MRNKNIDKFVSGVNEPNKPNDETIWINTANNTIGGIFK
jgi:hypothetical protein